MSNELEQHKTSDKIKWIITAIALVLIFALLGGLYALQFNLGNEKTEDSPTTEVSAEEGNRIVMKSMKVASVAYADNSVSTMALPTMAEGSCDIVRDHSVNDSPTGEAFSNTVAKLYVYANGEQIFYGSVSGPNAIYYKYGGGGTYNYYLVANFGTSLSGYSNFVEIMNKYTNFKATTSNVRFNGSSCSWYNGTLRFVSSQYKASSSSLSASEVGSFDVIITCDKVPVPLPSNPTKEGYRFVGWYYDQQFTRPYDGEPIYEDTALYAKFEINTYTVTFDSNGGSTVASQTVDWNTAATLSTPMRTGYTFVGWFMSNGTQYTNQPIKQNTTLTAHWEAVMCTVTFYVDGEEYDTVEVEYGSSFSVVDSLADSLGLRIKSYSAAVGEPLGDFITYDLNVNADTRQGVDKDNQWKTIGGVAGGIVLIALIVGVISAVKRKKIK